MIPAIEAAIGAELSRMITDAGYKGHHAPEEKRVRVYGAGPKRVCPRPSNVPSAAAPQGNR